MNGAATPYLVGAVVGVGWILAAEWLQRRTGQQWWTVDELTWGVLCLVLVVPLVSAGHTFVAVAAAGLAVVEFALARRNWVHRPRDLLERNRLELEDRDASARRESPLLGVRGWLFTGCVVAVWMLLDHWGLPSVSACLIAVLLVLAVFRPWRRSPAPALPFRDNGMDLPSGPPFDPKGEPTGGEVPPGRGFEFTLSGRPARLLGRAIDRLARSDDQPGQ